MTYSPAPPPDYSHVNGFIRGLALLVLGLISLAGVVLAAVVVSLPVRAMMKAQACDCYVRGAAMTPEAAGVLALVVVALLVPAAFTLGLWLLSRQGQTGAGARLGKALFLGCILVFGLFLLVMGPVRAIEALQTGQIDVRRGEVTVAQSPLRYGVEVGLWGLGMPLMGLWMTGLAVAGMRRSVSDVRLDRMFNLKAVLDNARRRPLDPRA